MPAAPNLETGLIMRIFPSAFMVAVLVAMMPTIAAAQQQGTQEPASAAPAQHIGHWFHQAARAYHDENHEAWLEATQELHRLRPYNQDFMTHLVKGYALTGDLSAAFDMMLRMQQQGLAQDWDEIDAVAPLREHRLYDHINNLMKEAGQPFGDVSVWSRLDARMAMPEALAYDGDSGRMFVGTVRDGMILVSSDGESWERFADPESIPQLQGVFDLAVDEKRGYLWVATGRVGQFHGPRREDGVRSSLLRLDLESGEFDREFPLSSGSGRNLLGSLAISGQGSVFAADTQSPVIYRLEADGEALQPYFGHQNFTSLRGITLSGDDRLLYVADYELGIFVIDARSGDQAWKLAVPDTLNEGGIDGLYWWNNHLVVIQNGVSPQRVVRMQLGEDGLGVTAIAPVVAARPEFDSPTFGVMNDKDLYFLAASHWRYVDDQGLSSQPLPEVPIMKLDVDAASVQVVGQQIIDQIMRQQQGQ